MAKNSFIVFYDYKEALADLTDEQVGKLFRALFDYEIERKEPNFEGGLNIAFKFIKKDLDINLTKYASVCERNRENGMKGGRPRNPENPKNPSGFSENPKNPVGADNDNDIINTYIYNREKIKENSTISTTKEKQKEVSHKYGEYSHVLLTDKQYDKLVLDYGKDLTDAAIKYLDEYIEMKGAVYKNHNLVLRKWVFDAVKEDKRKNKSDFMEHSYNPQELNNLFDNIESLEV